MPNPMTAIIVGAGHRALLYASYANLHPERLQIVGVADPNPIRRAMAKQQFGFADSMCFEDVATLAQAGKLADAIINGTMDADHVNTAVPLLAQGYHMLLEKPIALNEQELTKLVQVVSETKTKVYACHVLRYAPFYLTIKEHLMHGAIGDIIHISAAEHVSYHHLGVSYIRGKWGNELACGAPMLLAKCCHDMDLILWLKGGAHPAKISSFGGDYQFSIDKKPQGAAARCLDCPLETNCNYSARKHYLEHPERWSAYVWDCLEHIESPTLAQMQHSLATDNLYGKCVWDCGHSVVDHQTVSLQFDDNSTASLNMIGGAAAPERNLHIIGTRGEIKGVFDDSIFTIRTFDTATEKGYLEETIDLNITGDKTGAYGGHGGGDLKLVEDFVNCLYGEAPSCACTSIANSFEGHYAVFLAERARKQEIVEHFAPNTP